MYKVSVIIPVFNVENYIVRCAESLFDQTLDDMQFIFVDDASPDDSISRLERTIERYPQRKAQTLILHHSHNLGLPAARATGLVHADASYVAHCDPDDYVEPAMYAKLYEIALQNDADMVVCGRYIHDNSRDSVAFDRPASVNSSLIYEFLCGRLCPHVWCRLTRTDIYRRVEFPVANYLEDWVQTAQLLTYANKVLFLDEALYHYNHRPMSITTDTRHEVLKEKIRQCVENYNRMHDFIATHHHMEEKDFTVRKQSVRGRFLSCIDNQSLRRLYLQTFPELNLKVLFDPRFSLRYRAYHLIVLLGVFPIARAIHRIKHYRKNSVKYGSVLYPAMNGIYTSYKLSSNDKLSYQKPQ